MKVQFIREVHNKIQILKKTLKKCEKNNKIQTDKNMKGCKIDPKKKKKKKKTKNNLNIKYHK
jgi:hypothetical protein